MREKKSLSPGLEPRYYIADTTTTTHTKKVAMPLVEAIGAAILQLLENVAAGHIVRLPLCAEHIQLAYRVSSCCTWSVHEQRIVDASSSTRNPYTLTSWPRKEGGTDARRKALVLV